MDTRIAHPDVTAFFDDLTNTVSYVVKDPESSSCAVVDSVLDFDYASGRISYGSADRIIDFIVSHGLRLEWLIETHVHADHLSAAPYIQRRLGGKIGIGVMRTRNVPSFMTKPGITMGLSDSIPASASRTTCSTET